MSTETGAIEWHHTGVYRQCTTCRAPIVITPDDRLPAGWTLTFAGSTVTPHRPDCGKHQQMNGRTMRVMTGGAK